MISKQLSLSNRLFFAVTVVLAAFLGLSAFSLNNAFQSSADSAQEKELKNYVYSLLMSAEFDDSGSVTMPEILAFPEFSVPSSGLYAQITSGRKIIWQSQSMLGIFLALPQDPGPSNERFSTIKLNDNSTVLLNLAYGIVWENDQGEEFNYTLNISEDLNTISQQKSDFQLSLWFLLGGTGIMLVIAQAFILRWGLRPLHNVAIDLNAIETGLRNRLSGNYPKELNQLTHNINTLLDHEQHRRDRYKNSLSDLAHSLKTPLAVIQGEIDTSAYPLPLKTTLHEQLKRVSTLVDYQLQRAATEGQSTLQSNISLSQIAHKILNSLDKVYQSKKIQLQYVMPREVIIHADEGDMYELLGNLLENAYKYCNDQVSVFILEQTKNIEIHIEDNGKGVPEDQRNNIIKRGKRIDTQIEGHGLGLAIATDIIEAYHGKIQVEESKLGGARFVIQLPK